MSNRNRMDGRFVVEMLEARRFLSAAPVASPFGLAQARVDVSALLSSALPSVFGLSGSAAGSYTRAIAIPDVGTTYTFTGAGSVTPLGSDTLSGSLTTPGFILNGLEKGSLTLTNSKGTVTFSLSGPAVSPIAAATPTFKLTYAITGGTGAYKNLRGIGTATLTLHPTLPPPPLVFGVTQVGQFTLALKAGSVPLA